MTAPDTSMTPAPDLERIAAGLTKAQREAVLGRRDLSSGAGMWPLRNALAEKGLVTGLASTWTPLGLRVRSHLMEASNAD